MINCVCLAVLSKYYCLCTESKSNEKKEKELPGLDHFLAKNTSEDCASFEHIMEMAEDKEKLKHSWLYEAEAEFKQVCFGEAQVHSLRCRAFQYTKFFLSFSCLTKQSFLC